MYNQPLCLPVHSRDKNNLLPKIVKQKSKRRIIYDADGFKIRKECCLNFLD